MLHINWIKKKKLLLQFILSYIFIFVLPVLILGWIMHGYIMRGYTNDILERNTWFPHQLQANLDMQIRLLLNYAIQTDLDPVFYIENTKNNPASSYEIRLNLSRFQSINPFIRQVFFWPTGENTIYSSEGTYQPGILFNKIFVYEGYDDNTIRTMINGILQPVWWPQHRVTTYSGANLDIITFVCPIGMNNKNGVLIFLIERDTVQNLIGDSINQSGFYNAIIINDDIIYTSKSPPDLSEIIKKYSEQTDAENNGRWNMFDYNNTKMYIYEIKSSFQSIKYLTVIPDGEILQQVTTLQGKLNIIMLAVILVCSGAAFFSVYNNYKPIRRLIGLITNRKIDPGSYSNELDAVGVYLNELNDTNLVYTREKMFFRLLRGTDNETGQDLAQISQLLPGPYFRVLYLQVLDFPGKLTNTLKQKIQTIFAARLFSYVIEFLDRNTFAVICSVDNPSEGRLAEEIAFIFEDMSKESIMSEASAGDAVTSIESLKNSYLQAKSIYAAKGIHKHGNLLFSNPEGNVPVHANWYISQELDAFRDAIEKNNPNLIEFTASALTRQIQSFAGNRFIANCICYDVINAIFNTMSSVKNEWRSEYYKFITENMSYENPDDLVLIIKTLCDNVISDIKGSQKFSIPTINDMIKYIDNHFCDPNFSIKWLSAEFGISGSNFSHQFKARMGVTLMDYINRLKIDYAKHLLETTSLSVAQITEKLGYNHPSSFIKKFKQFTGNTPGKNNKLYPINPID